MARGIKENWWWNGDVKGVIRRKRLTKEELEITKEEENK